MRRFMARRISGRSSNSVKPDQLKTIVQLTGVLIALLSLRFFFIGVPMLTNGNAWGIVTFLLGLYSLYVGYLAVMRFSPGAIRQISIMSCFWLFFLVRTPLRAVGNHDRLTGGLQGLFAIFLIVFL